MCWCILTYLALERQKEEENKESKVNGYLIIWRTACTTWNFLPLCVCWCVYLRMCVCVCVHWCLCWCLCVLMCVSVYKCVYVYISIYTYTYMCISVWVCLDVSVLMCVCECGFALCIRTSGGRVGGWFLPSPLYETGSLLFFVMYARLVGLRVSCISPCSASYLPASSFYVGYKIQTQITGLEHQALCPLNHFSTSNTRVYWWVKQECCLQNEAYTQKRSASLEQCFSLLEMSY